MPDGPVSTSPAPSTRFALALLTGLARRGVRHIVLSPGSRSQALALVAAELERIGALRLHVRIDERVAGFLALGLAVESRTPVVVITTSGTATANLHPAVLEAHHSGVPLILLTADRPAEARGIRSNQTTQQAGLYGFAARVSVDVEAPVGADSEEGAAAQLAAEATDAACGSTPAGPGPVHLNVAFREPLSSPVGSLDAWWQGAQSELGWMPDVPATSADAPAGAGAGAAAGAAARPEPAIIAPAPGTLVVAGTGAGPEAEEFARVGGWPLVAEVASGARFGPNLVVAYRELLRDEEFGDKVRRVIVFGHPTLSREVPQLIASPGVETIVVANPGAEQYNPGHAVTRFERAVAAAPSPGDRDSRAWLGIWVSASRRLLELRDAAESEAEHGRSGSHLPELAGLAPGQSEPAQPDAARFARTELSVMREPITREMLVDAVWRVTWPLDRLVFGASRLIRDADRQVPGKRIRVHSNRGLAGIDGTVATGVGIALAHEDDEAVGVTRVLLGDLALLHDAGSLLFGEGERMPRIQVIVGNDGGGTIFDSLEVARTAPPAAMDRVLLTPQRVDLAALAAAYGWSYSHPTNRNELERALTAPITGPTLIEVPLPR